MAVIYFDESPFFISHIFHRQYLTLKPISVDMVDASHVIYPYRPSHAAAIILSIAVAASLSLHIYQGLKYRSKGLAYFMMWGGSVFTTGWVLRAISTYTPSNLNLYIAQYVFIYAGPPIYSAAEYTVLGRLLRYLPMHAPLNPDRVRYAFIYLGAVVEGLTGAGASLMATSKDDASQKQSGSVLISIALLLQAVIELGFIAMIAITHRRCVLAGTFPRNVRRLCIMLYGTSALVLARCVFRAIESFATLSALSSCNNLCHAVLLQEWYLYIFEALPMLIYTGWINVMYPGALLPRDRNVYLDSDGLTERVGPGWIDKRSQWQTFADPFDLVGTIKGQQKHGRFWLEPDKWVITREVEDQHDPALLAADLSHRAYNNK
ncbi:hypothetical protein QM012_004418 [Aureobasidium pullulans]|uniref:RTA1 domain protein n=1 Tax=Aureobasidium pullulans TaxID=5580 RepID=A0ABR0TT35_AURPU